MREADRQSKSIPNATPPFLMHLQPPVPSPPP